MRRCHRLETKQIEKINFRLSSRIALLQNSEVIVHDATDSREEFYSQIFAIPIRYS